MVGTRFLSFEGTPVFMDVEGIPDRNFYYLISLRYEMHGAPIEKTFWADGQENESDIWQECLRVLKDIDNPQIVHYGAYESRFLRHMRKRSKPTAEDAELVDRVVNGSLNLLASHLWEVYFPTFSNGLKDVARWLGFEWTWRHAIGGAATLLRRCWELTSDDALHRELITYNVEDCRAAALVAEALDRICDNGGSDRATRFETVNVRFAKSRFPRNLWQVPKCGARIREDQRGRALGLPEGEGLRAHQKAKPAKRRKDREASKKGDHRKGGQRRRQAHSCPACGSGKVGMLRKTCPTLFSI